MKIMSRNFTRAEKALLIILALALFALVYYRFVYRTLQDSVVSSNAEASSIKTDLQEAEVRLGQLQQMQQELDTIMGTEKASRMESYNNSKNETAFLSDILSTASDYSIAFADVTRNGDQIRRSFSLQYRTNSYREAEAIMLQLCQGEYRCLMGDINCSIGADGQTAIGMTATFFETMVGGIPDSGLPQDEEATANQDADLTQ